MRRCTGGLFLAIRTSFLGLAVALACAACAGCDEEVEEFVPVVTIEQGVWGVGTIGCDLMPCSTSPADDTEMAVYEVNPFHDEEAEAIAETITDGDGFYEMDLDAGEYVVCRMWSGPSCCTSISIGEAEAVRKDFLIGVVDLFDGEDCEY